MRNAAKSLLECSFATLIWCLPAASAKAGVDDHWAIMKPHASASAATKACQAKGKGWDIPDRMSPTPIWDLAQANGIGSAWAISESRRGSMDVKTTSFKNVGFHRVDKTICINESGMQKHFLPALIKDLSSSEMRTSQNAASRLQRYSIDTGKAFQQAVEIYQQKRRYHLAALIIKQYKKRHLPIIKQLVSSPLPADWSLACTLVSGEAHKNDENVRRRAHAALERNLLSANATKGLHVSTQFKKCMIELQGTLGEGTDQLVKKLKSGLGTERPMVETIVKKDPGNQDFLKFARTELSIPVKRSLYLWALAKAKDKRSLPKMLQYFRSVDEKAQRAIVEFFTEQSYKKSLPLLRRELRRALEEQPEQPGIKYTILVALETMDDRQAVPVIKLAQKDDYNSCRGAIPSGILARILSCYSVREKANEILDKWDE